MSLYFDSLFEKLALSYGRLFGVSWFRKIFNDNDYSNHFIKNKDFRDSYFNCLKDYFFDAGIIDFLTLGLLSFIEFNLLCAIGAISIKHELPWYDGKQWTPYIIPLVLITISLVGIILFSTYLLRFCFAISMLLISSVFITSYHAYRFNDFLKKTASMKLSIIDESGHFDLETIKHTIKPNLTYEVTKPKVVSFAELLNRQDRLLEFHSYQKPDRLVGMDMIFIEYYYTNYPKKYKFHVRNIEYQKYLSILLWMNVKCLEIYSRDFINSTVFFKNKPLYWIEKSQRDLTGWNKDALQLGGVECIQLMYIISKNNIPSEVARIILLYLVDSQFKIKTDMGIDCATQNAHVFFGNKAQTFYNERKNVGLSNYNLF